MKILHVITTVNRGGAENHLAELVRLQVRQGLDVAVAFLKGDGYWASAMAEMQVRVEPLELRCYGDLRPLARLRRLVRSMAPDIVHAHMPPAELYSRLALLFLQRCPAMVISKHNDEPFFRGLGQAFTGRWVGRGAARVIAISNAVNTYVRQNLRVSERRLTTVYYGLAPDPYQRITDNCRQEVRRGWSIPQGATVIGTVARFVPQKALHTLLRAYAKYRLSTQQESYLVIVGSGPLDEGLKRYSRELGLSRSVIWAGFRDDIPAVMNAFDTFALTSSYEGFGLVLLEAMAAARPVVASRVSAIPEIVEDGITGLLCEPGQHEEFARAFLRLEETTVRARLGSAGRERVLKQFTPERMAEATLAIYKGCLA